MGCGKSKHSVETATSVIKSTSSDGTKQTTTTTATKTVKETTGSSSLIQKEAETNSLCVEDTNKKPVTDPSGGVAKTDNVPATLEANVDKPTQILKDDVKVKDSKATENVAPASEENTGKAEEVVKGDEKVNDSRPAVANVVKIVIPTSSAEVVKEDEKKKESTLNADDNAKTDNVVLTDEDKMKVSNPTKDNVTKTEFLTPTLSEDVVGPFDVVKGSEEVKDSKEEIITTSSDEKPVKTIDAKDDNLKGDEQKIVVQASQLAKVEAKKEGDLTVTEADIVKAKISPATETVKVPTANGANATGKQEKEP